MTRIYEATLYTRPPFGDPEPVRFEGRTLAKEIAAESAGKARYRYFLDIKEAWDQVRILDIRVRSLSKDPPRRTSPGMGERMDHANALIRVIGSCGRRFLSENSDRRESFVENPFFAYFTLDKRNELWYIDRYTRKGLLCRMKYWDHGFSDGGTLQDLVRHLADYIWGEKPLNHRYFGPFPDWQCGGDPWGYGTDEMQRMRESMSALVRP